MTVSYLLSEFVSNIFYFNCVLLTRIIEKGFEISLTHRYEILCKLRRFSSEYLNIVSFTLCSFATIDQLLSTQRSNSK